MARIAGIARIAKIGNATHEALISGLRMNAAEGTSTQHAKNPPRAGAPAAAVQCKLFVALLDPGGFQGRNFYLRQKSE